MRTSLGLIASSLAILVTSTEVDHHGSPLVKRMGDGRMCRRINSWNTWSALTTTATASMSVSPIVVTTTSTPSSTVSDSAVLITTSSSTTSSATPTTSSTTTSSTTTSSTTTSSTTTSSTTTSSTTTSSTTTSSTTTSSSSTTTSSTTTTSNAPASTCGVKGYVKPTIYVYTSDSSGDFGDPYSCRVFCLSHPDTDKNGAVALTFGVDTYSNCYCLTQSFQDAIDADSTSINTFYAIDCPSASPTTTASTTSSTTTSSSTISSSTASSTTTSSSTTTVSTTSAGPTSASTCAVFGTIASGQSAYVTDSDGGSGYTVTQCQAYCKTHPDGSTPAATFALNYNSACYCFTGNVAQVANPGEESESSYLFYDINCNVGDPTSTTSSTVVFITTTTAVTTTSTTATTTSSDAASVT